MEFIKQSTKVVMSMFLISMLFFSITELDLDRVMGDLYELSTFVLFLPGVLGGTILLWIKEKVGSWILIITIVLEFIIFMIVDGELLENLFFLSFALGPILILWISNQDKQAKQ